MQTKIQILKCSALVLVGLIGAAVVYGQGSSTDHKTIKPGAAGVSQKAVKPSMAGPPHPSVPRLAIGPMSALPPDPQSQAEMRAAFAPSEAFRKQALSLYQSGDLAGAEAACLNSLNAAPIMDGKPQHVPFVAHLLGQVYLKDRQYEKAIYWLQGAKQTTATVGGGLDLDIALAYVRLGDYKHASQFYSDQAILQYYPQGSNQDLPGTDSPKNLEASILLARGLDAFLEHRYDDALPDLQSANHLAPNNALAAYDCARILSDKGRDSEAAPLYESAATGRGIIAEDAKRRVAGFRAALAASQQPKQ